jgi:hypothetical protein
MTRISRLSSVVIGVVLALCLAEIGLRLLSHELPSGSDWPTAEMEVKYQQLSANSDIEVVFLGSSMTEAALDPVEFAAASGLGTTYNSALPFSSPFSNEFWLETVVLEMVDPRLVVIGLPSWSGGDSAESDPVLSRMRTAAANADSGTQGLALLRHAGVLSEWDARSAGIRLRRLMTDLGHQTAYYDRSIEDSIPLDLPFGPPEMPQQEADAVRRMIDSLSEADIQSLVLIEPGRHPGDDGTVDYDRYIESMLEYSDYWGVPVLDSFHEDWDRSLFADPAHFNSRGTLAFTEYLARSTVGVTASR